MSYCGYLLTGLLGLAVMLPTAPAEAKSKKRGKRAKSSYVTSGTTRAFGSAYYANCSQARAAGAAPIRVGDPGYSRKLDRDGDGIACE